MRYGDGSAFRRALEDRLRNNHIRHEIPLTRLRKSLPLTALLPDCF